jgi:hypothetical protein
MLSPGIGDGISQSAAPSGPFGPCGPGLPEVAEAIGVSPTETHPASPKELSPIASAAATIRNRDG